MENEIPSPIDGIVQGDRGRRGPDGRGRRDAVRGRAAARRDAPAPGSLRHRHRQRRRRRARAGPDPGVPRRARAEGRHDGGGRFAAARPHRRGPARARRTRRRRRLRRRGAAAAARRPSASRCRATSALLHRRGACRARSPPSPRPSGSCAPRARSPGSSWSPWARSRTSRARSRSIPSFRSRVAGLTVMGGHVREVRIGELRVRARDRLQPLLGSRGLGGGARRRLPHHAGHGRRHALDLADHGRRANGSPRAGPLARALAAQIRIWEPVQRRIFTGMGGTLAPDNAAFLHDPLTVLALIDASPLRFESLRIATTIERGVLRTHELPGRGARRGDARRDAVDPARAARAIVDRLASA